MPAHRRSPMAVRRRGLVSVCSASVVRCDFIVHRVAAENIRHLAYLPELRRHLRFRPHDTLLIRVRATRFAVSVYATRPATAFVSQQDGCSFAVLPKRGC